MVHLENLVRDRGLADANTKDSAEAEAQASMSGSIMVTAKLLGSGSKVMIKAFPVPFGETDASVEAHVLKKIRRILDARESPFFIMPYSVTSRFYERDNVQCIRAHAQVMENETVEHFVQNRFRERIAKVRDETNLDLPQVCQDNFRIAYMLIEHVGDPVLTLHDWLHPKAIFPRFYDAPLARPCNNRMMKEVISLFLQLMSALTTMEAHGITHNDMHWNNIFVQKCDHSFVIDGVRVESQYIVKLFDWDRSVCSDETCVKLRAGHEKERRFPKPHVLEHTPGYDLVGFIKSMQAFVKSMQTYDDARLNTEYEEPMQWLLSEMLNPMADLFKRKPSLSDDTWHFSNPCLTSKRNYNNTIKSDDDT